MDKNAEQIVKALRFAVELIDDPGDNLALKVVKGHMAKAASLIESQAAEIARLNTDCKYMCSEMLRANEAMASARRDAEEAQRRERAAVEDIQRCCATCAHKGFTDKCPGGKCSFQGYKYWQWRGPQAGKGEAK